MANPRKPKRLKLLQNTYQPCRDDGREEIELPRGVPEKPEFINKVASTEWDKMVDKLSRYGILSDVDGAALEVYCELYAEFRSTRSCPSAFPAAKYNSLRAAYTDLGLSPVARTKIPGSNKPDKNKNRFAPDPPKKKKRKTG